MKKISVLVLVTVIMAVGVARADNVERIKELEQVARQSEDNIRLYREEIKKQEIISIGANSIIGELKLQDQKAKEAEKSKKGKKKKKKK